MCKKTIISLVAVALLVTGVFGGSYKLIYNLTLESKHVDSVILDNTVAMNNLDAQLASVKGDVQNVTAGLVVINTELGKREIQKRLAQKKEAQNVAKLKKLVVSRGTQRSGFLTLDLRTPSNLTPEQFDKMLVGTPLHGYGYIFSNAEKKHGVNGLFLAALTGREQSFGAANSGLKVKKNLTSYGAYDGQEYKARTFSSYNECIDETAALLKRAYLSADGLFFGGYTVLGVNKRYATSKIWGTDIADIMEDLVAKLK